MNIVVSQTMGNAFEEGFQSQYVPPILYLRGEYETYSGPKQLN